MKVLTSILLTVAALIFCAGILSAYHVTPAGAVRCGARYVYQAGQIVGRGMQNQ